ncbi:hypothetical protein Tco_0810485 [Tanacetum coccineum]
MDKAFSMIFNRKYNLHNDAYSFMWSSHTLFQVCVDVHSFLAAMHPSHPSMLTESNLEKQGLFGIACLWKGHVLNQIKAIQERISKKRTKNEAKTTKPDTEWKSVEKTKGIAMLAISLFPTTFAESMAVITLKEAQVPWMAEMKVLKALTEETQERRAET